MSLELTQTARQIRLVLTDVDGVLTDGGVYYGPEGEAMKRFNIRDGMGVERLRAVGVDVGIITGEKSESVKQRAEKLHIDILHLYCKDKVAVFNAICTEHNYQPSEIAYIGDDVNDFDVMRLAAFCATPADGFPQIQEIAQFICKNRGGNGAFREVAEFIIAAKSMELPD